MVILIFTMSISLGTGIFIPDPDLNQTGLSFPLSLTASGRIKNIDLYSKIEIIPTGTDNYQLDFYLLNVGILATKGIFGTKFGAGLGRIKRALSQGEKGACYDLELIFGPIFPINDFTIYPSINMKMISDMKEYSWIAGLGVEIGYEIR